MKPEVPPSSDPLLRLLNEWEVRPELAPGFEQRLQRRIAAASAAGWRDRLRRWAAATSPQLRWSGATAVMALLLATGVLLYRGNLTAVAPVPAVYQTAQVDPVMRDLQTLANDGDLLDHLDFLSQPAATPKSTQERD